jgi:aldehyde dehydrogenase (NAD+)
MNAGQTCVAPDYVLVHEAVEVDLVKKLGETMRKFYGKDPKQSKHYGRIVNERHHARLTELLEGAEVAVGGEADATERYLAPTLVPNVKPDSPLMRDEIFGPILPVLKVRDVDEAITFVNEREKPLALYIFTGSEESERKVVAETSSGGVCVNATIYHLANPDLPFGGVGASGMGSYHGRASFEAFSHRKSVMRKSTRIDPKLAYPPYSRLLTRLLRRRL